MKKYFYLFLTAVFALTFSACSDDDESVATSQLSILKDGVEVQQNEVLMYDAVKDEIFNDIVAGHDTEPTFVAKSPCNLSVSITIPENKLKHIQWCGITGECQNFSKPGTYTRVHENLTDKQDMVMHANFEKDVFTSCMVKVDVKVNGKNERTFYIQYNYTDKKVKP